MEITNGAWRVASKSTRLHVLAFLLRISNRGGGSAFLHPALVLALLMSISYRTSDMEFVTSESLCLSAQANEEGRR